MKYSLGFRIWHWFHALVILGLLATVLLRETFLSWRKNSEIIMTKLTNMDFYISMSEAKIIAKAIRADMWEWHTILGYALVFLVLYRVVLFFQKNPQQKSFQTLSLHKKGVQSLYYLFYLIIFFMSASGLIIHFYHNLGITKSFAHDIKELHEFFYTFILYFVPIHIAGVVFAENTYEKGLVSSMINGTE